MKLYTNVTGILNMCIRLTVKVFAYKKIIFVKPSAWELEDPGWGWARGGNGARGGDWRGAWANLNGSNTFGTMKISSRQG